jgi:hypothetical protein
MERERQEGRQEGMAEVITRLIERRVGPTDLATGERISKLSSDQLQSLGDALLEFTAAEDLAKWLDSN